MENEIQISELSLLKCEEYVEPTPIERFKLSFIELLHSPFDLFYLFLIKIIGYSGFSILTVCGSIYVTKVIGLSDKEYGLYALGLGGMSCLYAFTLGIIPDRLGIRFSMIISSTAGIVSYLLLIYLNDPNLQILTILILFSIPLSINVPASKLGIKKYTNTHARSIAFSIFIILVFACGGIAGIIVGFGLNLGSDEEEETYISLFWIAVGLMMVALVLSFFLRELDYNMRGNQELQIKWNGESVWESATASFQYKSFWRVMAVAFAVSCARSVYLHLTITLPLYMERDIKSGSQFGYIIALNQFLSLIFCPTLTMLVYYIDKYTLLLIGCTISALSPLVLLYEASYTTVIIFVLCASFGESIHFPRLIEYTLESAAKGREGAYFSISNFPISIGYMFAGLASGLLLNEYCPEDGERQCWMVWLVISLMAMCGVLVLFFCRKWIEQPLSESNPYMPWSEENIDDGL
ncbi:unnamed protein product [Blepharisma stoltei]|uniref:Major facilitator superfamily (MFS) profile domain-containing protein n=1 Tax=Blepharisma stoltei TaxID=1481888 RepID=A0AAU9J282_9CILI|nr:unnamed protein product [Blepharisma stoltei]